MATAPVARDTLRIEDIAAHLGKSVNTLYNWIRTGKLLPPMRLGRPLQWDRESYMRWYEEQRGTAHAV